MDKATLLKRLTDIEWDDFEVKDAAGGLPKNIWETVSAFANSSGGWVVLGVAQKGVGIDDSPQYDAIKEALVNLLMHCDYFSPMKPRIRVFTDRIEFENPGAFPRPVSELLKKDISLPRNPVIAKLFRNVRLADNAGFGFDKMLQWEKFTQAKVIFENSIDVALVAFILNAANKISNERVGEKVGERVGERVGEKLTENQQKMMDCIVQNPYISASELSPAVGISKRKIEINISKLKAKGLLERIGSNKGGYWKVIDK